MSALRNLTLGIAMGVLSIWFAHGAVPVITARPGVNPDAFRITTFATNLFFPYGMARLPDNSFLVGTSRPRTETDGYFASRGELIRLTDANGDGVADGPPQSLVVRSAPPGENQPGTNIPLPGVLVDVRVVDQLVVAVSAEFGNEQILFLRLGPAPDFPLTLLGHLRLGFPHVYHQTYGLLIRPSASGPGRYDIVFNVGSLYNRRLDNTPIPVSGLLTTVVYNASIYRLTLIDQGSSIQITDLHPVAGGVRNAAGLSFDPVTGDLWFSDNGIDQETGVVKSADELNFLRLGEATVPPPDFGYPNQFVELDTGITNGLAGVQPILVFREVEGDGESEGPAQMTSSPPRFPVGLNHGYFLGFHGDYDGWGTENHENAVVYADPATGKFLHFLRPGQPDVGHLDGVMATEDSLFVVDLTGTSGLSTYHAGGVIYQIKHVGGVVDCGTLPPARLDASLDSAGSTIRLSWDARLTDCQLESTPLEAIAQWSPISEPVQTTADRRWVSLSITAQPRFFRLRCPECKKAP